MLNRKENVAETFPIAALNSFQTVLHVCMTVKWALIMKKHIIREFMMGFSWYRQTNTAVYIYIPTGGWNKNKCVLSYYSRTSLVFSLRFIRLRRIESHSEPVTRFIKPSQSKFPHSAPRTLRKKCLYAADIHTLFLIRYFKLSWDNSCWQEFTVYTCGSGRQEMRTNVSTGSCFSGLLPWQMYTW